MRHHTGRRVDRESMYFLRRLVRHFFDIHAAFGRYNESNAGSGAIDECGKIEFALDSRAFLDIEPVDLLACRARLYRNKRPPKHFACEGFDLLDRACEPHAAFVARFLLLEFAFAAAAGMDLALDDPERAAKL